MEVFEILGILRQHVGLLGVVAVIAAHHHRIPVLVFFARIHHRNMIGFANLDKVLLVARCPGFELIPV